MANQGVAPADFTSPVGQTRLFMGDTDAVNPTNGLGDYVWFGDAELAGFLALCNNDPRRAAVSALRIVAMTPAMKLRKWTSADLQVDGAAITAEINALIDSLQEDIKANDAASGYFEISREHHERPFWDLPGPIGQEGPPFLTAGIPFWDFP
jgi:hypothetical protein